MKKNKMMRLASCLMVAVLLTTSVISGTFAKYVADGNGSDFARVAKWGVTVTARGDAFEDTYVEEDEQYTLSTDSVVSTRPAPGQTPDDVVAPGTTGELVAVSITGTPEVAARVTATANLTLTGWTVEGVEYCPLVFTIDGVDYKIGANNINTVAELEAAVEGAVTALNEDYEPNTNLASDLNALNVVWTWPFSTSTANDVKDTVLGNADAGSAATIAFEFAVKVEQIN